MFVFFWKKMFCGRYVLDKDERKNIKILKTIADYANTDDMLFTLILTQPNLDRTHCVKKETRTKSEIYNGRETSQFHVAIVFRSSFHASPTLNNCLTQMEWQYHHAWNAYGFLIKIFEKKTYFAYSQPSALNKYTKCLILKLIFKSNHSSIYSVRNLSWYLLLFSCFFFQIFLQITELVQSKWSNSLFNIQSKSRKRVCVSPFWPLDKKTEPSTEYYP